MENKQINTKTNPCKNYKIERKSKLMILNKFLFVSIFISGIFFVITINDLSIKGFVLQDMKKQVSDLSSENRNVELRIMELESFDSIAKRANEMKMVRVDKIDYISLTKEDVAMK
jgi:cell division protein FtsL